LFSTYNSTLIVDIILIVWLYVTFFAFLLFFFTRAIKNRANPALKINLTLAT